MIDAAFSVVSDGTQRSVFASGRLPLDRTLTAIGPIQIQIWSHCEPTASWSTPPNTG
ncbi:hypothetical protein MAUB1S_00760 [Mycolicibacterium aubagnense]